jgi:membrane fusion protein, multidrug efflux system
MVSVANKDSEHSHVSATAPVNTAETRTETVPLAAAPPAHPYKKWFLLVGIVVVVAGATYFLVPHISTALNTVSTDDAYVNGDVTYVAPRVNGQVARVLVADNNVVRKGELLLELDSEPYEVQVNIAQAAVDAAKAELITAQAQVCGIEAQARSLQFSLMHAIEVVHDRTAELRASVAGLDTAKASLTRATSDYQRALAVRKANEGAISPQDVDRYLETYRTATAQVSQALEHVHQIRVSLGLPATPKSENELAEVPADLDQTFSAVREVQGKLMEAAATLGVSGSFNKLPHDMEKDFFSRYPNQDIDQIFAKLLQDAPDIKRAQTKLLQAERNLDQAKLNLRYCKVYAEIDGAITGKNVNPGNNVTAGQSLMTIRALNDLWIDANFKETQLAKLRIGQPVKIETDMYGSHCEFQGRISGFTMGTGQTLSLLPPQNATGNYVKIVQRLPVKIELTDYDPDKAPLFAGLSVTPYVYFKEPGTGPNAGRVLQPRLASNKAP